MKNQRSVLFGVALFASAYALAAEGANELSASNAQLQWSRSLSPVIKLREGVRSDPVMRPAAQVSNADLLTPAVDARPSPAEPESNWSVLMSDKTLYRTMRRWAQEANYQLLWQIDRDYPIEANLSFQTDFRGAVEKIMAGVALTDFPLQGVINPTARVLRVVRYMDEDRR